MNFFNFSKHRKRYSLFQNSDSYTMILSIWLAPPIIDYFPEYDYFSMIRKNIPMIQTLQEVDRHSLEKYTEPNSPCIFRGYDRGKHDLAPVSNSQNNNHLPWCVRNRNSWRHDFWRQITRFGLCKSMVCWEIVIIRMTELKKEIGAKCNILFHSFIFLLQTRINAYWSRFQITYDDLHNRSRSTRKLKKMKLSASIRF